MVIVTIVFFLIYFYLSPVLKILKLTKAILIGDFLKLQVTLLYSYEKFLK